MKNDSDNLQKLAWPIRPDEVEKCINSAVEHSAHPVHVDTVQQYTGRCVSAVTISKIGFNGGRDARPTRRPSHQTPASPDAVPPDARPAALLFSQPHAHEP